MQWIHIQSQIFIWREGKLALTYFLIFAIYCFSRMHPSPPQKKTHTHTKGYSSLPRARIHKSIILNLINWTAILSAFNIHLLVFNNFQGVTLVGFNRTYNKCVLLLIDSLFLLIFFFCPLQANENQSDRRKTTDRCGSAKTELLTKVCQILEL